MALSPAPQALVLRALGLGDLLTAVPALRGVRAALPEHRVVLAAPAALEPLARLSDAVDEVLDFRGLRALPRVAARPDVAVNLHGRGPQSHRLLLDLAPRRLVAFANLEIGGDGPAWREDEHEVVRWCRLVEEALGVRCDPAALDLAVPPGPPAVRDAVMVHPGAAYPSRRWPADRFAAVARHLAGQEHRVVVTGTASEAGLARSVAWSADLPVEAVLAGRTSVADLARLVAAARLVVSGDTGVAHLAAAYRRPSVTLFGPVPPARWGPPRRDRHVVLWAGRGGGDPRGAQPDPHLLRLSVDQVLAGAEQAMAAQGTGALGGGAPAATPPHG